jgi:hypothetical protein
MRFLIALTIFISANVVLAEEKLRTITLHGAGTDGKGFVGTDMSRAAEIKAKVYCDGSALVLWVNDKSTYKYYAFNSYATCQDAVNGITTNIDIDIFAFEYASLNNEIKRITSTPRGVN